MPKKSIENFSNNSSPISWTTIFPEPISYWKKDVAAFFAILLHNLCQCSQQKLEWRRLFRVVAKIYISSIFLPLIHFCFWEKRENFEVAAELRLFFSISAFFRERMLFSSMQKLLLVRLEDYFMLQLFALVEEIRFPPHSQIGQNWHFLLPL